MRTRTHTPKKELNMSGSEPIILSDLLFSKIPGSPKRKRIPLFVELTPTQLHIFEAVGTKSSEGGAASSLTWSARPSGDQEFKKGKHIRTLWRDHEEDIHNIRGVSRPGRRSHMYKFHIQRPDGLYKFKCFEEECRDRWLKELTTITLTACDFTAPQGALQTPTVTMLDPDGYEVDVPSIPGTDTQDGESDPYYYTAVSSRSHVHMHSWLEPLRSEGEGKHYPLKRQPSTESDLARSRSSSMSRSESGYSSSDHELAGGNGAENRSASLKRMPNWDQLSQPTSPTDANKSFIMPLKVSRVPTRFAEDEEPEDHGALVQLSDLRHLTKHLSLDNLADSNLKSLSPVPEENESADCENDSDLEVVYLLEESLEYQIGQDGTTISLIEDLGIIVDVPRGALPADHLDDVTIKINVCISGPFELPDGYELASPIFHIEPGVKFAEKVVELLMVHFIDLEDEDDCSELTFVSAPLLKQNCQSESDREEKGMIRFKCLNGGMFWPGRRIGKISLQHFCLIGIAQLKREKGEKGDMAKSSSILRPKPAALSPSKEGYTALLYSPVSFPEQLPRTYHVIFSISLSHPVFIKNLEKQLAKRFSIDSEFWRTSCKVNYAGDTIELEIPHDTLREYGCEVQTDLGCMISKRNVDDIRRSRLSRSDYASYIDYPPRILLRIHQTSLIHQLTTPSKSTHHQPCAQQQITQLQHPKLTLKGTVEERSFTIPLPASNTSSQQLLSPQHSQLEMGSQPSTPTSGYSLRTDRRSLVSLPKRQSIHSVPDLKDLGEKVTPHLFPKWYHIGIQLGLPPVALTGMERQYQNDIQRCMNEVFYEWISRSEETPTWMTLIETLRADSINERQLASELERTFIIA